MDFNNIKEKHGKYGSWAIWSVASDRPKSGIGDLSIFASETIKNQIKPSVIMVGLNLSRYFPEEPFRNFHDPSPHAQDYKIRHAFHRTDYYGAYMTDIIKGVVEVDSKNIPKYLLKNPSALEQSLKIFREELRDLGAASPLLLAFGRITYQIIKYNLLPSEYRRLIRLTHYSHQISKEKYREKVLAEIQKGLAEF